MPKKKVKSKTKSKENNQPRKTAPLWWIAGITVILISFFLLQGKTNGKSNLSFYEVKTVDIVDKVILQGVVKPKQSSDLSFEISGQIDQIYVDEGDYVDKGDTIAILKNKTTLAEIEKAKADVTLNQAKLNEIIRGSRQEEGAIVSNKVEKLEQELLNTIKKYDAEVEEKQKNLLTTGLEAYTSDIDEDATPPTITGQYQNQTEGSYIISVYSSDSKSGFSYRLSGLEDGIYSAAVSSPGPLGSHGLFIQFHEGQKYNNTVWEVSIPNQRSESYISLLGDLNSSKKERDLAVSAATTLLEQAIKEEELDDAGSSQEEIAIGEANLQRAKADLKLLQVELDKHTLKAPFSGIVSKKFYEPGEVVAAKDTVVSLLGEGGYEISVNVPEIDIKRIEAGQMVDVTLDAFGENIIFTAINRRVNPTESIVDGVSVYEAIYDFNDVNQQVKSGMTANVSIVLSEAENVLAIPYYLINTDSTDKEYVEAYINEKKEKAYVETGLRGHDNMVEIKKGLSKGDLVIDNGLN